jgi:hypothetical protein
MSLRNYTIPIPAFSGAFHKILSIHTLLHHNSASFLSPSLIFDHCFDKSRPSYKF